VRAEHVECGLGVWSVEDPSSNGARHLALFNRECLTLVVANRFSAGNERSAESRIWFRLSKTPDGTAFSAIERTFDSRELAWSIGRTRHRRARDADASWGATTYASDLTVFPSRMMARLRLSCAQLRGNGSRSAIGVGLVNLESMIASRGSR